jgi:hypothetical protein
MKACSTVIALALAAAAFVACTEVPPAKSASILQAQPNTTCPLGVAGARVVVDDAEGGVVMTFSAGNDKVEDLRMRTRDQAGQHGPGQKVGPGHEGRHGMGGDHGLKVMQLPPATITQQDIEGGSKLFLVPADKADLEKLRAKVRERAQAMMTDCN